MAKKVSFIASGVAPATKSAVTTMVDSLHSTKGLNVKVMQGCRYLQVRIHSKVISHCSGVNQEAEEQAKKEGKSFSKQDIFAWNDIACKCEEYHTAKKILQDSETPLWARKFIARFFKDIGLPIDIFQRDGKTYYDLDGEQKLSYTHINGLQSALEKRWNCIRVVTEDDKDIQDPVNCIGNQYPEIIPEDDKHLRKPKPREVKSTAQKMQALASKLRDSEFSEDKQLGDILSFLFAKDDDEKTRSKKLNLLLLVSKAAAKEKEEISRSLMHSNKANDGAPKTP